MNYRIILSNSFLKEAKRLAKKYSSFKEDLEILQNELQRNPYSGIDLGNGLRKVRMAIKSKGRGKSHGARVITYLRSWELNYELKKCYLCTHKDHGLYSTQHTLCRVAMPGFFFDFGPTAKNQ